MVRLIHWKAEECAERGDRIRQAGYECDDRPTDSRSLKDLRTRPPRAIVIDLTRLPMQGRDVAAGLRASKSTRPIPIVFAGGEPEKVAKVRELLPDAVFTEWDEIEGALRRAIGQKGTPIATESAIDGYRGTPLAKKLGVGEKSSLLLIDAPDDFPSLEMPPGVKVHMSGTKGDTVLWFVRSFADLQSGLKRVSKHAKQSGLWIIWPKKTSRQGSDLTQFNVREAAFALGLVDYKVASIDSVWTGMKFTVRK